MFTGRKALLAPIFLGAYTTRLSHCCALKRWNTKLERFQVSRMVRLSLECLTNGAPRLCSFRMIGDIRQPIWTRSGGINFPRFFLLLLRYSGVATRGRVGLMVSASRRAPASTTAPPPVSLSVFSRGGQICDRTLESGSCRHCLQDVEHLRNQFPGPSIRMPLPLSWDLPIAHCATPRTL